METESIETESVTLPMKQVQEQGQHYPQRARELSAAIHDDSSFREAAGFAVAIKDFRKKVSEAFDPVVKKAYDAWKAVGELRKRADGPLDEAERIIKNGLATYQIELDRKARIDEENRRTAIQKAQDDAQLNAAVAAENGGDKTAANAILNESAAPIAPQTLRENGNGNGVSYREVWKCEVSDLKALVAAVAAGTVPLAALESNDKFLGQQARSLKGELSYPGVRVWAEKTVSVKANGNGGAH